ncbi:MAG: hypothetical protein ACOX21_04035 [Bacillota bacterium]|jgi:hypothetical protein
MWKDLYAEFTDLDKKDQIALFEAMKIDLYPEDPSKITELLSDIRETR